jgi:hypothetical protein
MANVFAAFVVASTMLVSPAFAAVTCLETRDIMDTRSDGKIMEFQMRDGRTYINHLQGICPDLKFSGFVWTVRGLGQVCENVQGLRALSSGQTCVLGKFDAPKNRPNSQDGHVTELAELSR